MALSAPAARMDAPPRSIKPNNLLFFAYHYEIWVKALHHPCVASGISRNHPFCLQSLLRIFAQTELIFSTKDVVSHFQVDRAGAFSNTQTPAKDWDQNLPPNPPVVPGATERQLLWQS